MNDLPALGLEQRTLPARRLPAFPQVGLRAPSERGAPPRQRPPGATSRNWSPEDHPRADFLRRLDAADFEVTDWEAQFIGSILQRERWRAELLLSLTPNQRDVVDKLIAKYEHRLPGAHGVPRPTLPDSVPGQCAYCVRDADRRQTRCGRPATKVNAHGLELCPEHKAMREEAIRRDRERKARR